MNFEDLMVMIYFGGLGLLLGSFVNAWVYRTREGLSLNGRSICTSCSTQLKWYHNIPLFSYVFLKGKCGFCKSAIPLSYPAVELFTAIFFFIGAYANTVFHIFEGIYGMFAMGLLFLSLTYVTVYDFKYKEIPDQSYLILAFPTLYFLFKHGISIEAILSGFIWPAAFLILDMVFKAYLKMKIRFGYRESLKEGEELPDSVGGGDIKLALFLGLMLPVPNILVAFIFSYFIAFIFVIPYTVYKNMQNDESEPVNSEEENQGYSDIPFGPWMILSFLIILFSGNPFVNLGIF